MRRRDFQILDNTTAIWAGKVWEFTGDALDDFMRAAEGTPPASATVIPARDYRQVIRTVGHDGQTVDQRMDWNPLTCGSAEEAAKGAQAALVKLARNPEVQHWYMPEDADDIRLHAPGEHPCAASHGVDGWWLNWDAGPMWWSMVSAFGPWGYVDTYWGWDWIFTDEPSAPIVRAAESAGSVYFPHPRGGFQT